MKSSSRKGQQEALTAVLLSGILIGVVGSVYFWGIPLIQKSKDNSMLESSEQMMADLDAKIKFVANNGGRDRAVVNVPGVIRFDGSSLELTIETEGTLYAVDAPIQLGRTSSLNLKTDTSVNPPVIYGVWGLDDPVLFNVKSSEITENKYITTYSLDYIELRNDRTKRDYKIELSGSGTTGGLDKSVVIESLGESTNTINGRTLISSLVKISIV
jgi:hypothetical protein